VHVGSSRWLAEHISGNYRCDMAVVLNQNHVQLSHLQNHIQLSHIKNEWIVVSTCTQLTLTAGRPFDGGNTELHLKLIVNPEFVKDVLLLV
jgi:hypothetical protein